MPRNTSVHYQLNGDEREALMQPINGNAGGQALVRKLQGMITEEGVIVLSDVLLGKIVRYAAYKKGGGFQSQLKSAFGRSITEAVTSSADDDAS